MADLATLPTGTLTPEEKTRLDGILIDLVRYVERSVRAKAATRLSRAGDPPPAILRALALDEIDIAKPILCDSKALSALDLAEIAREGTRAHRLVLAGREDVPEPLSEALVDHGDIEIVDALVSNKKSKISPKTLDRIAEMYKEAPHLHAPLLARPHLSPITAYKMFWWVSSALRQHIVEHYPIEPESLDNVLKQAVEDGIVEARDDYALHRVLDSISRRERRQVSDLIETLRRDSIADFTVALGQELGVDPVTAERIVNDKGGEAIALAARALEAEKTQFMSLYLLLDYRRFGRARPASHLARVEALYDKVTRDAAAASVALWQCLAGPAVAEMPHLP
jgi:uncharacterized protein (DUF2336 family)